MVESSAVSQAPAMNKFHRKCGDRVTLLNHNLTAIRNFVEFNHGLILSADPLTDDALFEVRIDRKVNVWNGSLEIGVTTLDPEFMELPATATKLRNTAWILSGNSIVKDGVTIVNSYGPELDTLREGDCVGVTKTSKGELMFFINGRCLGIAARDLPSRVFAVIDLYGQCVQVSIIYGNYTRTIEGFDQVQEYEPVEEVVSEGAAGTSDAKEPTVSYIPMPIACPLVSQDHLRFHPRCGILVKLSANNKTAERARPLDDYNNGVVMTHRPLYDNELFEIRIDRLVDKWSGSIEVGVTTHNPATIRFPSTMTNMDSGTIMMSGCKVLLNGHGTCMEYGNFNLDELREGDTVGMMRKGNGKLHYFINGIDQGVATDKVAQQVWGVIDLYGMTVKVTIVDPCEDFDSNMHHMPIRMLTAPELPTTSTYRPAIDEETLLFHTLRDSNIIILNDGKTAHRPNAFEFFDNGIVMTNRTLKTNELFQVRLDLVIPKWAGSIEIGVTIHSSNDIKTPSKISNAKSGTWAVTGEDVIRDGYIIIPRYVRNLNRLVEGDTVGVMRKDIGILHFFVNGVDQGPAAFNIPEHVFGIIDLYGRVAQATIVDVYLPPFLYSPESPVSTESTATVFPEMCFHRVHGRNARLSRNRLTASRATVYSEFNDAVLFSSRPLRECDMFELRIDKMVDCWIGNLEIGVTAIRPDDLEGSGGVGAIAGTATDLSWDTYILSGAAMMKDGECVRSGYPLDLDALAVGSRVGMMWHADRSLHYYLDGMDMGKAWYVPHLNIYAVIDLYGQCTQVTILQNEERTFNYNGSNSDHTIISNPRIATPPPPYWSFSEYIGENISLSKDHSTAKRLTPDPMGAIVFSSTHLIVGEIFEIKILECKHGYAGSFRIGVTDVNILNANVNRHLPLSVSWLSHYAAYVDGRYLKCTKPGLDDHSIRSFVPSFEWLRPGDRLGLKKTSDSRVIIYYNSEPLELGFEKVPDKVYAIMDMFGHVTKIQTVSRGSNVVAPNQQTIPNDCTKPQATGGETSANEATNVEAGDVLKDEENTVVRAPMMTSAHVGPNGLEVRPLEGLLPVLSDEEPTKEQGDPPASVAADEVAVVNETVNEPPQEPEAGPSTSAAANDARPRQRALPYTFHYMHGKNIKLCSSDTVAMRVKGFTEGVAIASQPLRRGHYFRFRVDKLTNEWQGTVCIGAVALLPNDPVPSSALYIDTPCWVISNDVLYNRGRYTHSEVGRSLDDLIENTVLTLHFQLNSELTLEVDGDAGGTIARIPRMYSHIFPIIDLYGKIIQVSILLHPHILHGVNSLDLPMIIEENHRDEPQAETTVDCDSPDNTDDDQAVYQPVYELRATKQSMTQRLIEEEIDSNYPRAGPSNAGPSGLPKDNDVKNKQIRCLRTYPFKMSLHHSLILTNDFMPLLLDNDEAAKVIGIQKSRSTQNISQQQPDELADGDDEDQGDESLVNALSLGSRIADEDDSLEAQESICDTNIRHNDRFPEASEVDNLDNEIMDALTLDPGNLPDLSDERSPSVDESTRRDDIWPEGLALENLVYLNGVVSWEGDSDENVGDGERRPRFADRDWVFYSESNGNCEHMHIALKFWNHFVLPYPDMREIVACGQVRCHCQNCQPNAELPFAGWVRIERAANNGAASGGVGSGKAASSGIISGRAASSGVVSGGAVRGTDGSGGAANSGDVSGEAVSDGAVRGGDFGGGAGSGGVFSDGAVSAGAVSDGAVDGGDVSGEADGEEAAGGEAVGGEAVSSGDVSGGAACSSAVSGGAASSGDVIDEAASSNDTSSVDPPHMYWHIVRSTLVSAQAVLAEHAPARRPRSLAPTVTMTPPAADVWFDEEGKPHHAVLALDIDVSGPDPENDRLLAYMIFLRSQVTFQESDPLSFED